ncbi:hypothetical protein B0T22DRAFT_479882 [Podospora appendiculata]|uniref:Uncharacterized protein n=1 Tax=Podospora appendiculata TaxID=314037 RepID=A0AAE0XAJ2_9PEZI|nr:hypothetical protein B0T22DRAFT_479882 [Podospora appendiculata]
MANPLPVPAPSPSCTTYLTSYITGFHGDFTAQVVHTVYTTTHTVLAHVPCHGCSLVMTTQRSPIYGGVGPEAIITAVTTAKDPLTVTRTYSQSLVRHRDRDHDIVQVRNVYAGGLNEVF